MTNQIPDDVVERASKEYADATGYYVPFHAGLRSASSDSIRKGVRAAGRVFVEWERAATDAILDEYGDLPARAAIARTEKAEADNAILSKWHLDAEARAEMSSKLELERQDWMRRALNAETLLREVGEALAPFAKAAEQEDWRVKNHGVSENTTVRPGFKFRVLFDARDMKARIDAVTQTGEDDD